MLHRGVGFIHTIYLNTGGAMATIPNPGAETAHTAFGSHLYAAYFSQRGTASRIPMYRLTRIASTNRNTVLLGLLIGQQE